MVYGSLRKVALPFLSGEQKSIETYTDQPKTFHVGTAIQKYGVLTEQEQFHAIGFTSKIIFEREHLKRFVSEKSIQRRTTFEIKKQIHYLFDCLQGRLKTQDSLEDRTWIFSGQNIQLLLNVSQTVK